MDVLAFYATCAPSVHPTTTSAIVRVESGGNPLAIHNNTLKRSYAPRTRDQAVQLTQYFMRAGHSLDVGLMQINSKWISTYKLPVAQLFDACYNVSVGGRILTENYNRYAGQSKTTYEALWKALSAYNTGHPYRGATYVANVMGLRHAY